MKTLQPDDLVAGCRPSEHEDIAGSGVSGRARPDRDLRRSSICAYDQEREQPAVVATITHIDGHLLAAADDAWRPRVVGQSVAIGETIQSDDRSRAVVSFDSGLSLRLDRNTTLRVASTDRVVLTSGALYVDSPPEASHGAALTVQAHAGSVRHIGTQYEVRTHAEAIVVSVREGRVMIVNDAGSSTGEAGEGIRLTPAGEIARTTLSPWHPDWEWVSDAAPPFDIENQPLSVFLKWIARETGRQLVYSSPETEAAAGRVKLRGSIAGLDLDTALMAVLATTQFRRFDTQDGFIGIASADDTKASFAQH
jgi:ferric-dicitrate binding protein FerR (iron transport regulator)